MKEAIQKIIEEINLRTIKDYKKMDIQKLSSELRDAMEFERGIFQKIEDLKNQGAENDLTNYARIVCKNSSGREISEIQEAYLIKIETEYLGSN